MEIKSARFMEKEHSRMWRDEIDARGYVAKEIHVAMNDNRVVIVTAEHQHGSGIDLFPFRASSALYTSHPQLRDHITYSLPPPHPNTNYRFYSLI